MHKFKHAALMSPGTPVEQESWHLLRQSRASTLIIILLPKTIITANNRATNFLLIDPFPSMLVVTFYQILCQKEKTGGLIFLGVWWFGVK